MTGNKYVDLVLAIQGLVSAIATLVALFTPKHTKVGAVAARIGMDMKRDPDVAETVATTDKP